MSSITKEQIEEFKTISLSLLDQRSLLAANIYFNGNIRDSGKTIAKLLDGFSVWSEIESLIKIKALMKKV